MALDCSCSQDDGSPAPCCGDAREDAASSAPCCGGAPAGPGLYAYAAADLAIGWLETPVGGIPRVSTTLNRRDRLGGLGARMGIGRMRYAVQPGLYAVGSPTAGSPVLVSANYKLSFDHLRSRVSGLEAWVLVLDTKGINVWCAAGGGLFGTDELVARIAMTRLADVVSHHRLVVPQLAATGVSAHQVRKRTGFAVAYGPVRASDIGEFLQAGMKATPEMRRVRFALRDRAVVIPVELVLGGRIALLLAACLALLSGLGTGGYALERVASDGPRAVILVLGAFLAGAVLVPLLLPWLPGRAFSLKGAALGVALDLGLGAYAWTHPGALGGRYELAAWLAFIPAVTSFLGMNFTGASTYTSLSGVRLETRVALPVQLALSVAAAALWLAARFV